MYERPLSEISENPFRAPEAPANETEARYTRTVSTFARRFLYDDVPFAQIERDISALRRQPDMNALETSRHGLESILHLLKGIESHELANDIFGDAWQAALTRQERTRGTRPPKAPETLTREDVAAEFAAFRFKQQQLDAERSALTEYERLIELNPEAHIPLSKNISLKRADIETLMNDLRVRAAERNPNEEERTTELKRLDQELRTIIENLSDEDWGKRFELEEVYLLRRLIHAADTGHLVAVMHGTPREDLRPDRGSVDLQVTAAGDRFGFQLKTFKAGVSAATRERQNAIVEHAERNLEGAETHLVVLKAEQVRDAYDASLRQAKGVPTSLADKFAALQPIADTLRMEERHRLVMLLGLTEEDLLREQEAFNAKVGERRALEETIRTKEAKLKAEEEKVERLRREEEEERRAKLEAIAAHQRESLLASQQEREERTRAKEERLQSKQRERDAERDARAKIEAQHAMELARLRAEEERREARRLQKQYEKEHPSWPPKNMTGLSNVPSLQRIGLLATDWKGDTATLLAAKKSFLRLFAKPKTKTSPAESDKPNPLFAELFPTKERFEEPTTEAIARVRSTQ